MTTPEPAGRGNNGWFKAWRTTEAMELIKKNPHAFTLAYIIAARARYSDGFNADGLARGEAKLGDIESYCMTPRNYRTAKEQLAKYGFATFKTTNRGTLGKLTDTRLFDPLNEAGDNQNGKQPTRWRHTGGEQPTTNKKENKDRNEEGGEKAHPSLIGVTCPEKAEQRGLTMSEKISKEKELGRATSELRALGKPRDYDVGSPERNRIKELKPRIFQLREELDVTA